MHFSRQTHLLHSPSEIKLTRFIASNYASIAVMGELTEVIFCLHAIFVAADYLVPSVLPILLMLLAIDVFCALLCIIQS